MLNKTLAQLAVIAYIAILSPLFIAGLLLGFALLAFKAGYFWGEQWADDMFTAAASHGESWIARIRE